MKSVFSAIFRLLGAAVGAAAVRPAFWAGVAFVGAACFYAAVFSIAATAAGGDGV